MYKTAMRISTNLYIKDIMREPGKNHEAQLGLLAQVPSQEHQMTNLDRSRVINHKPYLMTELTVTDNTCFTFFFKDASDKEPEISGERELKIQDPDRILRIAEYLFYIMIAERRFQALY